MIDSFRLPFLNYSFSLNVDFKEKVVIYINRCHILIFFKRKESDYLKLIFDAQSKIQIQIHGFSILSSKF